MNLELLNKILSDLLLSIIQGEEPDISKEVDAEKKDLLDEYVQGYDVNEYGTFSTSYYSPSSWEENALS